MVMCFYQFPFIDNYHERRELIVVRRRKSCEGLPRCGYTQPKYFLNTSSEQRKMPIVETRELIFTSYRSFAEIGKAAPLN
jgi:hypothetical protein